MAVKTQNQSIEFNTRFPDTINGFLDYITQDENGEIASMHINFRNTLTNIYYNYTPEEFEILYNNFILNHANVNRINRRFLTCIYGETRLNTIKRIYNITKTCEMNEQDARDPRYIFTLQFWLNTWRS